MYMYLHPPPHTHTHTHTHTPTPTQSVIQLGGQVTERGSDCTHIVLPRVTRTVKFLCGISMCQYIVTPAWIESSASTGGFVREEDYRLEDKDAMELFGMTVATSLARARARKLLKVRSSI